MWERTPCRRCNTPSQIEQHNSRIIEALQHEKAERRKKWTIKMQQQNNLERMQGLEITNEAFIDQICQTCKFLVEVGITIEIRNHNVMVRYINWESCDFCLVCVPLYLEFLHSRYEENMLSPAAA